MVINLQYANRRGSREKLKQENPLLVAGEILIEKDTRRFKIGDGTSHWNDLKYANQPLFEMNRIPTATDDYFEVGQFWKNTTGTKKFYVLESVSSENAVWKQVLTLDDIADLGDVKQSDFDAFKASNEADKERIEAIAKGASRALVFATAQQLEDWIGGTYTRPDGKTTADLQIGDNLYVVALDAPDYWWDGEQAQKLETGKVDLTSYPTTAEVQTLLAGEVTRLTEELNKKSPLDSPEFINTPTAPTASAGTNTAQLATCAYVFNELNSLTIDGGDLG